MLKTTNQVSHCISAVEIDAAQRRYGELKRDLHILLVEESEARKGGGFKELSRIAGELEEIEGGLEAVEWELEQAGAKPSDLYYLLDADEPQRKRLKDYNEKFCRCDDVPLPTDIGEDF